MPYGKCKDCVFCRTENSAKAVTTCLNFRVPDFTDLQVSDAAMIAEKFCKEEFEERSRVSERFDAENKIRKKHQILLLEQYQGAVKELKESDEYKAANKSSKALMSIQISREFKDKGLTCFSPYDFETRFPPKHAEFQISIHQLFYTCCTRHSVAKFMSGNKNHKLTFPVVDMTRVLDRTIGCGEFEPFKESI